MQIKQHDDNGMDYFGITAGEIMVGSQGKKQESGKKKALYAHLNTL